MKTKLLQCECCLKQFEVSPLQAKQRKYRKKINGTKYICSNECIRTLRGWIPETEVKCNNCGISFFIEGNAIKKSENHFCSRNCSASYNNVHKTYGIRRSKLERWVEESLLVIYPNIEIHFNRKDAINSELDIYFPSLKIAFELNGIFHYEPIFGQTKFEKIQNNDKRKFQACLENEIEFCIIDSSSLGYFKKEKADKFLTIITNLVNYKLSNLNRVEVS